MAHQKARGLRLLRHEHDRAVVSGLDSREGGAGRDELEIHPAPEARATLNLALLPPCGPLDLCVVERWILVGGLPVQHRLVRPPSHQVDADPSYLVGDQSPNLLVGRRRSDVAVRPGMSRGRRREEPRDSRGCRPGPRRSGSREGDRIVRSTVTYFMTSRNDVALTGPHRVFTSTGTKHEGVSHD